MQALPKELPPWPQAWEQTARLASVQPRLGRRFEKGGAGFGAIGAPPSVVRSVIKLNNQDEAGTLP